MSTNDGIAPLAIRRGRLGLAAVIAGTALVVGFGVVSVGQSAVAAAADATTTIQTDPHSDQATAVNHADQAPVPPPVEMKAVPTVKATPYWGEPKPK